MAVLRPSPSASPFRKAPASRAYSSLCCCIPLEQHAAVTKKKTVLDPVDESCFTELGYRLQSNEVPRERYSQNLSREAFLVGLATHQTKQATPNSTMQARLREESRLPAEIVDKLFANSTVQNGLLHYDVAIAGEIARVRDLALKERLASAETGSNSMVIETVEKLFETSGIKAGDITHIVGCTCTAMANPGLDSLLVEHFKMPYSVFGVNVNFMGCHAGVKTMATAQALAKANPGSKVLFVCSEVCSLFIPRSVDKVLSVICMSLFKDGCAAGIMSTDPSGASPGPLVQLGQAASLRVPNTLDEMTWRLGEDRIEFFLSKAIPDILATNIPKLREVYPDLDQYRVGIHPGGPAVVQKVAAALDVSEQDTKHSYGILQSKGNMSSATILYVLESMLLEEMMAPASGKKGIVLAAFGPGLATEAIKCNIVRT